MLPLLLLLLWVVGWNSCSSNSCRGDGQEVHGCLNLRLDSLQRGDSWREAGDCGCLRGDGGERGCWQGNRSAAVGVLLLTELRAQIRDGESEGGEELTEELVRFVL